MVKEIFKTRFKINYIFARRKPPNIEIKIIREDTLLIIASSSFIIYINFSFFAQCFYHIFDICCVTTLHLSIFFPEVCTKILLLLVYSLVPGLYGVYLIDAMCSIKYAMPPYF